VREGADIMNIWECMYERRSIREFVRGKEIPQDIVEKNQLSSLGNSKVSNHRERFFNVKNKLTF